MKHKISTLGIGIITGALAMATVTTALAASGQISFNNVTLISDNHIISEKGQDVVLTKVSVPSSVTYTDPLGGDTTYLPVRKTAEALNSEVLWDESTNTVTLNSKNESKGYDTPEHAVNEYIDALSNGDFPKMISTFAIETYAKNYDLQKMVERMKSYNINLELPLPAGNSEFVDDINIQKRLNSVNQRIFMQMDTLLGENYISNAGQPRYMTEDGQISEFLDQIDTDWDVNRLKTLEVVEFIDPNDITEMYSAEPNQIAMQKQADIYGADDYDSIAVKVNFEGNPYLFCFQTFRYGEKWYISELGGNIGILIGFSSFNGGVVSYEFFD